MSECEWGNVFSGGSVAAFLPFDEFEPGYGYKAGDDTGGQLGEREGFELEKSRQWFDKKQRAGDGNGDADDQQYKVVAITDGSEQGIIKRSVYQRKKDISSN